MLVFFIHGVATKDADYSKHLQNLLKREFTRRNHALPHFYSSFWGVVYKQTGQLWHWIHQDLQELKKNYPQVDVGDVFRYQEFREDFISQFFGDILTYFNTSKGKDIREIIAEQLYKFVRAHPEDDEIHIVTHSLGSVVLWDVLFSEQNFESDDPAYEIRALLGVAKNEEPKLRSITTMGSPILFFNMMLNVKLEKIADFARRYQASPLRWTNIIHSSDIIAYPIQASLNSKSIPGLFLRDKYIWADANAAERGARTFGQAHAAMAIGVTDAHGAYWHSPGTARLITANLLGDVTAIDSATIDTQ